MTEALPRSCARFVSVVVLVMLSTTSRGQEPSGLEAAVAIQSAVVEAIAKAEKSVVAIARVRKDDTRAEFDRDPTSPDFVPNEFGTGVIIDANGSILTPYHVLRDVEKYDYYVWTNHRPFKARASVAAADPWLDLAVIKIDADGLKPIAFGDAKTLKKGQLVVTLGNPYAIARDGEVCASWGIISNLKRQAPRLASSGPTGGKETLHHYGTLIQTDAKLNLGTSGGALVNLKGEMVGLTTAMAALAGYEKSAGFAVPVNEAFKKTVETLKAGRQAEFGFLGVRPENRRLADRQQGRFGALVGDVVAGTPAVSAGLQRDDIITHVNGVPIYNANTLIRELSQFPVESRVVLTIRRGAFGRQPGRVLTKLATLSKKFIDSSRPAYAIAEEPPWRGLRVDYATALPPFVFQQRAIDIDPAGCVAVVDVDQDTPAWKSGLRPGSFISHVDDQRVSKPVDFYAAVADRGGAVRLRTTGPEAGVRTVDEP